MSIPSGKRMLWFALGAGLAACGGENLTLPADGKPSSLSAISGNGQEATVGSQLPDPLKVRLRDAASRPVSGISLAFQFQTEAPGAQVDPPTVETNDSGFAEVRVRLGTTTGAQTIEARLADDQTSDLSALFGVTALAERNGNNGNGDGGKGKGKGQGHDGDDDDD
jgi:hypothetical protein